MMVRFARFLSIAVVALGLGGASAQASGPEDLVKKLATDVTAAVRSDPDLQNPNSPKLSELFQRQVAPRFDFEKITQQAMGKNWNKASGDEKRKIIQQFSFLLTRTYSKAMANLKDLDVEVRSTKVNVAGSDVTVRTQMTGRAQPVAIDYSLSNASGGWRVYDVEVEGVSLIAAYRDEFNGLVSSAGVDGLIAALQKKNGS
jgi:phospholipid transport system substrate-binding protein